MRATEIKSCYIGPEISPEQFIPEHIFLYLAKGTIHGYDGNKHHILNSGDYCLIRKNRLGRYNKVKINDAFEKIFVIFDASFLKRFQEKYKTNITKFNSNDVFIQIKPTELIPNYIQSLMPLYNHLGKIEEPFAELKREELLLILLKSQPELSGVLFDFGKPEKINLEAFMTKNFKFNVSIQRFAYLTGRSLSAFKRDFKEIFNDTPNHWLITMRLKEAHFLLDKKQEKPSDIYLDLGFEDLSHFSFSFKKQFGYAPSHLTKMS
ncbi:helix-turn-helix domain-containing protein [Rhizosphaericola mali]|uniref:Helix-turn-helix transcriptional regulator n=1 Tax=Rhizosphaericola mali TaxID=2545455 RepID=A0A5P2FVT2_9BACT|nr:AraC family transcriptional regulator [Rhizosphaericola mali]QES87255.1 helix-turn-helix transcriptional regulator [Rhizosphaericola mali]